MSLANLTFAMNSLATRRFRNSWWGIWLHFLSTMILAFSYPPTITLHEQDEVFSCFNILMCLWRWCRQAGRKPSSVMTAAILLDLITPQSRTRRNGFVFAKINYMQSVRLKENWIWVKQGWRQSARMPLAVVGCWLVESWLVNEYLNTVFSICCLV